MQSSAVPELDPVEVPADIGPFEEPGEPLEDGHFGVPFESESGEVFFCRAGGRVK